MKIRIYQQEDEEAVIALWTSVFGYAAPHNEPSEVIRCKVEVQSDLFFVALIDGCLVGTVMGGYDGHRGWIYSLAVADEFREQGIGMALMRHVEQALTERGCKKINLQVLPSNSQTVAFYAKLGYAVEERISLGKIL